jgi:hypothetical protein
MASEPQHMQLDEFVRDASKILDELQATDTELLLEDRGRLFRLVPKRTSQRRKRFSREDPLFALLGSSTATEQTDVARNTHKYLAQAYEETHQK